MGVCALDLIFGIREKRFKVTIGCRYTIREVFENESESKEMVTILLRGTGYEVKGATYLRRSS